MFNIKLLRFGTFELRLYHVSSEIFLCFSWNPLRFTTFIYVTRILLQLYVWDPMPSRPASKPDAKTAPRPVLLDSFHYVSQRFSYVLLRFKMAGQFMLLFGMRLRSLCTLQLWDICLRLAAFYIRLKKHTHVWLRFKLTFHYVYRWPPQIFWALLKSRLRFTTFNV